MHPCSPFLGGVLGTEGWAILELGVTCERLHSGAQPAPSPLQPEGAHPSIPGRWGNLTLKVAINLRGRRGHVHVAWVTGAPGWTQQG